MVGPTKIKIAWFGLEIECRKVRSILELAEFCVRLEDVSFEGAFECAR